jgi:hypothetical protein
LPTNQTENSNNKKPSGKNNFVRFYFKKGPATDLDSFGDSFFASLIVRELLCASTAASNFISQLRIELLGL